MAIPEDILLPDLDRADLDNGEIDTEGVNEMVAVVVEALTLDAREIARSEMTPVMIENVPFEVVAKIA
jgi:hypothetical protein